MSESVVHNEKTFRFKQKDTNRSVTDQVEIWDGEKAGDQKSVFSILGYYDYNFGKYSKDSRSHVCA